MNETTLKTSDIKQYIVVNIGKAKSGDFSFVKSEIEKVRKLTKKKVFKVILETCYFDENDIIKLSKICMSCKVDFVKTSTGFGSDGAKKEVVSLIKKVVGHKCKIKASGGIKTREQAIEFINLGVDRIGTSSII